MDKVNKELKANLRKVKKVIQKGWCKGWFYKDKKGRKLPDETNATNFCLLGACHKVTKDLSTLQSYIASFIPNRGIAAFNDNHTKKEVIALLDKAIAEVK